ncbi:ABC transporter ATP-binding protein [Rugosimonospora africana]|uniref:ABC-type quaternary amine transporter n=1 Tax=Rugosimonospora africana TaxID=556532 RepID=A0A8J3R0V1_9ACTN|nr:ABC transporter ATP-binding protein [Rugosimonospora africana]GIH18156.1 proline/glycine betaine ABC transporter ATP-binding protein [Rugosimonospora africana]
MDGTSNGSAAPITLERVGKRYPDGTDAVNSLSLDIPAGELVVLIGPSGCGKSTVLRMINRLIEPTSGRILLDGADVNSGDAVDLRRRIGYVIQNTGLFPHQTIRANVATVPKLLGWSRRRIDDRVTELLDLVGLDPARYGKRYPHELSGGQRQRVGVARALAADPVVLLMDEPFSAVDPIVRVRLQDEFLRLQATVRKTIVMVTHDIDEAVRMGDRIAVLSQGGTLQQYASPAALLSTPANDFVREFIGSDRGIKRLTVLPVPRDGLTSVSTVDDVQAGPSVSPGSSLRDALAALLDGGTGWVAVRDDDGTALGVLTPTQIALAGAAEAESASVPAQQARPSTVS